MMVKFRSVSTMDIKTTPLKANGLEMFVYESVIEDILGFYLAQESVPRSIQINVK